jgi:hypothetical protein
MDLEALERRVRRLEDLEEIKQLTTCTYVKGDQAVWGAATYHDRYVRENGAWRFQHVRVESHFWTPFEDGWARMRFMQRRNATK